MNKELKNNRSRKGIATGLIIIGIGVILLLRKMGILMPDWLWNWYMIPIVIGVAIGISSNFKRPGSWILIGFGVILLINDLYYPYFQIREYFWPLLIIAIGLIVLIRPRKKKSYCINVEDNNPENDATGFATHKGDKLDSVSVFNGLKRHVVSKNFKGGESVSVFGGTEINLLQADFEGTIELECVVVFGGAKLIVPPNWEVRVDVTSILGGVEDKRVSSVQVVPDDKVLMLTGVVVFGGLDIVSY